MFKTSVPIQYILVMATEQIRDMLHPDHRAVMVQVSVTMIVGW